MRREFDLEPLEQRRLLAATLLQDINTWGIPPLQPAAYPGIEVNGVLLFAAFDGAHGQELWRTDGTPEGTFQIKRMAPGFESSHLSDFVNAGNRAYFKAFKELWASNGTADGTVQVKSGDDDQFDPTEITVISNALAFVDGSGASASTMGARLWVSDGSRGGTRVLYQALTGDYTSHISELTALGSKLFFVHDDGTHGIELWVADGNDDGTRLFREFTPGASNSSGAVHGLTLIGEHIYFFANTDSGNSLWRTDGTEDGTVSLGQISSQPMGDARHGPITQLNDTFIFAAEGEDGLELWKSQGTNPTTEIIKDILPGTNFDGELEIPRDSTPKQFTLKDGLLYFIALDETDQRNLWRTDGTADGTVRVKIIDANDADSTNGPTLLNVNGTLFLGSREATLWKSDGTEAGTIELDANSEYKNARHLTHALDKLFFIADHEVYGPEEPWVWDEVARISGKVFWDEDHSGTLSAGERGLGGWRVWIDSDADGRFDLGETNTRTTSTGRYTFDQLPTGTYWIRLTPVEEWRSTTNVGFKVTAGNVTRHFGVTRSLHVSGTVYMDANVNGGKDESEDGLSGWRVFLDLDLDGIWDDDELSTLTDETGRYRFTNLGGGTYAIRVVQQDGYKRTVPKNGIRWVSASPGQIVTKANFGEKRLA